MAIPTANQYLNASRRINTRIMPAYVSGLSPKRNPDMTGLNLWLDADSITGKVADDTLDTWSDKSGNSRDATQGTAGTRPYYVPNARNGRAGVWFPGDRRMVITMTTPAWGTTNGTAYVACQLPKWVPITLRNPIGWSSRTDEYWWYNTNTSYIGMMRSARLEAASIGFTAGTHVITVLSGASAYNVYDNGATLYTGSSAFAAATSAYIGDNLAANATWLGYIYEILIYNVEHTADQMQTVWNYIKWRWQIG